MANKSMNMDEKILSKVLKYQKKHNLNFSQLVNLALTYYLDFDWDLFEKASRLGAALGCDAMTVIENLAWDRIAYYDQKRISEGPNLGLLDEFELDDRGRMITGIDQYNRCRSRHAEAFAKKNRKMRLRKKK